MDEGRGRTCQMGRGGRDQPCVTGSIPDLRTRRLLHGVDKRGQPAAVHTACAAKPRSKPRSRCLKLLSHRRRIFPERLQPGIRRIVPAIPLQRKCSRCDLLHRGLFRAVVVVRNDPRNAPDDVGPAARYRDRLRPDRHRRGGRLDRAGFPYPDLKEPGPAASSPLDRSARPQKGSGWVRLFPTTLLIGRRPPNPGPTPVKRNASGCRGFTHRVV
ncbi:hypothetical protein ACVIW0_004365 [Bradyrhizobium sp. USDA 4454]